MAPKKDFMADTAKLLAQANKLLNQASVVHKAKVKAEKKKVPCKKCSGTPIVYRGLCQNCIDEERNVRQKSAEGKRWISTNGYEYIYNAEMRPVLYSRFRMEQILERPLQGHEQVGHKDGNKVNNADENLVLTTKAGFDLSSLLCPHCDQPYISLSAETASSYEENSPTIDPDLSGFAGS